MKVLIAIFALASASAVQAQVGDRDVQHAMKAAVEAATAAVDAASRAGDAAANIGSGDPTDALAATEGSLVDAAAAYPDYFDPSADAMADVDAALAAAQLSGKQVLLILGGDWCHDSIALMDVVNIPRTQTMIDARYEIVRVHVPYSRDERELPVAQRFGIAEVEGTPTVLILRSDGTPTNLADAPSWRNAASRKPAAIHRALEHAAPAVAP